MSDEFLLALMSILWLVNSLLFQYCDFIAMFGLVIRFLNTASYIDLKYKIDI